MQTNESIIAVPPTVEETGQTRQFLVRLVEQIDIVLGRRGGDPYVSASDLLKTNSDLSTLEKQVLAIVERALTADSDFIAEILESTIEQIDALKSSSTITDADVTPLTYSGPPTKSEVEALDAREVSNSQQFNDLLAALRSTGIIAT